MRSVPGGVQIKVRAAPGASRERVAGVHAGALKVSVQAPPERGRANEAVARVLARSLGLRASQVSLRAGEASRDKWYALEGVTLDAVRRALEELEP
ncbi:MAG: DUF167 domain-containing protein [Planctomycetes bacterium]|nr:DUF167 domain-containing protein [Planctomycetota bacterium]